MVKILKATDTRDDRGESSFSAVQSEIVKTIGLRESMKFVRQSMLSLRVCSVIHILLGVGRKYLLSSNCSAADC